jgi:hypothetical protein
VPAVLPSPSGLVHHPGQKQQSEGAKNCRDCQEGRLHRVSQTLENTVKPILRTVEMYVSAVWRSSLD